MMLPALAAAQATAQAQSPSAAPAQPLPPPERLPGKIYHSAHVPYKGDEKKKGRRFFYGKEHSGFTLESHETVLGPGVETHPAHSHSHEEIIIVVEGAVEVTVNGTSEIAETGSVIYYEPNTPHNLRNTGTVPARYYVVELRGQAT